MPGKEAVRAWVREAHEAQADDPVFHVAAGVFPSHFFVGVMKKDGTLSLGEDLMRDLWLEKENWSVGECGKYRRDCQTHIS